MSYVYIKSEPGLYTVGFYDPEGAWCPESDHKNSGAAAERVHYLNGGEVERVESIDIRPVAIRR